MGDGEDGEDVENVEDLKRGRSESLSTTMSFLSGLSYHFDASIDYDQKNLNTLTNTHLYHDIHSIFISYFLNISFYCVFLISKNLCSILSSILIIYSHNLILNHIFQVCFIN